METKVIILVTDKDDEKHGEISIVEDMKKGERLVETLMEAGFEQERIRVFTGGELNMQVSLRPVVSLKNEESVGKETSGGESDGASEKPAQEEEGTEATEEDAHEESEVRFSSLFRKGS